jgi:hypothetical protein
VNRGDADGDFEMDDAGKVVKLVVPVRRSVIMFGACLSSTYKLIAPKVVLQQNPTTYYPRVGHQNLGARKRGLGVRDYAKPKILDFRFAMIGCSR